LYRKIFNCHKRFLWAVNIVLALCGIFLLGHYIGLLTMCDPIDYEWDWRIKDGHCGLDPDLAFVVSGIYNIVLDITLVILPAPIVWQLQLPLIKKISVTAMFALGIG
jgi:hypothetical protein